MTRLQHAVIAPDPVDFDAFIRARWPDLVARFRWVSSHGLDPEDVVQDLLLLVHARFADRTFATPDLLYGYCYVIGRNLVRSLLGPDAYLRHEFATADAAMGGLRGESADPEGIAIRNTDLARVYAELPAVYRQVLVLAGDGFDYSLIADVLSLPSPEAAKQLLYRARRRARRKLGAGPSVVLFAAWRFPHRLSATTHDVVQNVGPMSSQAFSGAAAVAAAMGMSFVLSIGGAVTPAQRAAVPVQQTDPRDASTGRAQPIWHQDPPSARKRLTTGRTSVTVAGRIPAPRPTPEPDRGMVGIVERKVPTTPPSPPRPPGEKNFGSRQLNQVMQVIEPIVKQRL